ncbi:MAG TPA: hypothetical protein VIG25_07030 [Pyrinomonadaceae bacterium]|jgi:hypothetical protein
MHFHKTDERGSARVNFIIVLLVLGAIGYCGYLYVPVMYREYLFKDWMQHTVDVASASGYKPDWVSDQLTKSLPEYDVPADALITPANRDNRVEVRVQYIRKIEFPGYTYQYQFDHTARSTAFLTFK